MRVSHFIPLLFIVLEACVDPLTINLLPETQKFVVEGLITNDPGPYEVKLSYTLGFNNTSLKKPTLSSGASVWIYDELNNVEKLSEVSPGIYQTSKTGIRGTIGRAYYLKIKTKFGREYETPPQRMAAPGDVEDISFEFVSQGLTGDVPGSHIDALRILVDARGAERERNLLRWRWTYIFKARTFPEFKTAELLLPEPACFGGFKWAVTPIPEPCSGYVRDTVTPFDPCKKPPIGFGIRKVSECNCCECWPYGYSVNAIVSHNRMIDGSEFKDVNLGLIPATSMQFHDKYYLKVEQLSLSDEAYDFWDLVGKQQAANGNIFQPNSVKIKSNVKSLTDPEEEVLGLFGVSGIARKEIYISANIVPYRLPPIDTITHDCSNSFQNLYSAKPTFW